MKTEQNLSRVGQAIFTYANAHGGTLPTSLRELFTKTDIQPDIFIFGRSDLSPPSDLSRNELAAYLFDQGHCTYRYFGSGHQQTELGADTILILEPQDGGDGGPFVLFGDNHAERMDSTWTSWLLALPTDSGRIRLPTYSDAPMAKAAH